MRWILAATVLAAACSSPSKGAPDGAVPADSPRSPDAAVDAAGPARPDASNQAVDLACLGKPPPATAPVTVDDVSGVAQLPQQLPVRLALSLK